MVKTIFVGESIGSNKGSTLFGKMFCTYSFKHIQFYVVKCLLYLKKGRVIIAFINHLYPILNETFLPFVVPLPVVISSATD